MRRLVGPFSRVEGDLELTLDIEDGVIAAAHAGAPLYRGFEQLLCGRPPMDALIIAPRICGICSVSQSLAVVEALRPLTGVTPTTNGRLAMRIAHAAENIADHLTHFAIFFLPDFARDDYSGRDWFEPVSARFTAIKGSAAADYLPERERLLNIMGLIAGKWPHSLAFRPGGVTRALDLGARMRLAAIVRGLRGFFERVVIAMPLEEFLAIASLADLDAFRVRGRSDFAAFLNLSADLGLAGLGRWPGALLASGAYAHGAEPLFAAGVHRNGEIAPFEAEAIAEHLRFAQMRDSLPAHPSQGATLPDLDKPNAYSLAKAPRLAGEPAEVGAFARQLIDGQPLIRAHHRANGGSTVEGRVIARIIEVARLIIALEAWTGALDLAEPWCVPGEPFVGDGEAAGHVEAARGALGHWIAVSAGRIARYQIIAPTTWNFSPRDDFGTPGPLETALAGTPVGERDGEAAAVQHIVRSFDPCMVCTAH